MRILGVITVILILIVYYLYEVKKTFNVKFKLDDISLKDFNLSSLNTGKSFVETRVQFFVFYVALFNIVFSDLYLEVYYENQLVAKSSDKLENFEKITLQPNYNNLVYQTFDLKINAAAISLIYKIKTKQKFAVNYKLSAKVFGIQINQNKIYTN